MGLHSGFRWQYHSTEYRESEEVSTIFLSHYSEVDSIILYLQLFTGGQIHSVQYPSIPVFKRQTVLLYTSIQRQTVLLYTSIQRQNYSVTFFRGGQYYSVTLFRGGQSVEKLNLVTSLSPSKKGLKIDFILNCSRKKNFLRRKVFYFRHNKRNFFQENLSLLWV